MELFKLKKLILKLLYIILFKLTQIQFAMKRKLFTSIFLLFTVVFSSVYSQGFQPPSSGKSVVYFVRPTSYAMAVSFEYFHNDKYIGAFKGKNYMRYECDPGQQLLWISSENKEFIECDLQEGGSYIVLVNIYPGVMKARMESSPINSSDERFAEAKSLILSEQPVVTPQEKIDATNKKLEKFIAEWMKRYNEEIKGIKETDKITPDMAIPQELIKM